MIRDNFSEACDHHEVTEGRNPQHYNDPGLHILLIPQHHMIFGSPV